MSDTLDGISGRTSFTRIISALAGVLGGATFKKRHTRPSNVNMSPCYCFAAFAAAFTTLALPAIAGEISSVHTERDRATIQARLDGGQELRFFVGDGAQWHSADLAPKAAAFSATVEISDKIPLDDGSTGRGLVIRVVHDGLTATTYEAIRPDGPIPFGELVFRKDSEVSSKDGAFTFADIRQPDGTLVPVSVQVRNPPPDIDWEQKAKSFDFNATLPKAAATLPPSPFSHVIWKGATIFILG